MTEKKKIEELERKVRMLEDDLETLIQDSNNFRILKMISEIQEEVAKIKNEPVGMLFTYRV